MNLAQIEYFLDAVESHSIHQTAEKYNISPQGASKAIRSLEQELGIILIKRSTKGVYLTENGEKLLENFKAIKENYQQVLEYCNKNVSSTSNVSISGEIKIAVTPRFADTYLSRVLSKFNKMYPKIKIKVDSMSNNRIFQKLQTNVDYDIGIVTVANVEPNIEGLSSFLLESKLQYISYCTKELYMCGLKDTIKKIGEKWSIEEDAHSYPVVSYEYGGVMGEYRSDSEYQVDSITAQLNFINQKNMIGAYSLDEFKLHFNARKHMYIPIESPITLTYGSVLNMNHLLSEAEKNLLQFLHEYFSENMTV